MKAKKLRRRNEKSRKGVKALSERRSKEKEKEKRVKLEKENGKM